MSENKFTIRNPQGLDRKRLEELVQEYKKLFAKSTPVEPKQSVDHHFQFFDSVQTRTNQLQQEIHQLKDRQEFEAGRIDDLEFRVNIAKFLDRIERIEEFIVKTFTDIPRVKHVSYLPTSEGLRLIIIHDSDNRVEALNTLQKGVLQLEDAFTGIYFEPVILHISEIDSSIVQNVKTIIQK